MASLIFIGLFLSLFAHASGKLARALLIHVVFNGFSPASAQLEAYPQSVEVAEGTWANFTCTIKTPGTLYWRIGSFVHKGYDEHTFYGLNKLEGVRAEEDNLKISGTRLSETIEILATKELDGTPVECVFELGGKKDYSPFALLNVYPAIGSGTEEGNQYLDY